MDNYAAQKIPKKIMSGKITVERNADAGGLAPRQPASMEILELCANLATRAAHLAEYVNGKLHPVMNSSPPAKETCDPRGNTREYPPLFNGLRTSIMSISGSLDAINEALDRTEL